MEGKIRETSPNGKDNYKHVDFWRICDECGFKYRASKTRKRWDNMIVCFECWEPQHPQESVRGHADKIRVEDPRPEGTDTYIETPITQDDL